MDHCPALLAEKGAARLALIAESHVRLTGRRLIGESALPADALWTSPIVIVAHDTSSDPIFFFGNGRALALFDTTAENFTAMPSRLSVEPGLRAERARLMAQVTRDGFIDDYSGVRVSVTGRRFRIHRATIWNLVDAAGHLHGQAAAFSDWTDLA